MTLPARACRQRHALLRQKGLPPRGHRQFGRSLAVAVGLRATQRIGFSKRTARIRILVDLVGRDHDRRLERRTGPARLEHPRGAHDVDVEGFRGLGVAAPHQRLRRQMEDDLRIAVRHRAAQGVGVANVGDLAVAEAADVGSVEQVMVPLRRQRVAGYPGAHLRQPECQPAALEAGMAGQQDALAGPEGRVDAAVAEPRHYQTRQGASPRSHIASSARFSRSVSIGCQKPSCWKQASSPAAARRSIGSRSQTSRRRR